MSVFENAKFIWLHSENKQDEYVEFKVLLNYQGGERMKVRLSCDGDYTLFVGGRYASSNQYGDYEHYKIYDEIDITSLLKTGENELNILVWHTGRNTQRYILAQAGLIFEILKGERVILSSNEKTLCRLSPTYQSGAQKLITCQLGFSFSYDARKLNSEGYQPAVSVEKQCRFFPRPIKKSVVGDRAKARVLKAEGNYYLIDLLQETVGLPTLDFYSKTEQKILVAWGEDLQEGRVRRKIADRDFSFEYIAKKGENTYTNYMLRLGCRYIEVFAEHPIQMRYIGVLPQTYPVQAKPATLENALDQKIYDVCVHTLKCCLMEHYVDTPWREQCFYAFDSRNQMLCGYQAFENGNFEYARANLLLASKDNFGDGLFSICFPCGVQLTIPSFTLYYTLAVKEYMLYSKDYAFGKEVLPRIFEYMQVFLNQRGNDGLVCRFQGDQYWNFYDWTAFADGEKQTVPDAQINMLTVAALQNLQEICSLCGEPYPYGDLRNELALKIMAAFYDEKERAFSVTQGGKQFTELVNAFAIAFGLVQGEQAKVLCERLASGEFLSSTLSMKCFTYDALLKTDFEKWQGHVLDEIRKTYKIMLDQGATSFWETAEGAAAFDNAGSLCHGWTAIPVYYYHKFKMVR